MSTGIFGSHVFSGFGQIGLGLINLDQVRASFIERGGGSPAQIDSAWGWAQKVNALEAGGQSMSSIMNSVTDATYAHYLQALNLPGRLPATAVQALAYEGQHQYMATHTNPQIVTTAGEGPDKGGLTKDLTAPTGEVAKSNLPLILGGVAAVAVVGGLLYWKLGKKTAAAA